MSFQILVAQVSEWLGAIAVAWLFLLSPRLKFPPIGFKFARRDGITALSMFALILLLAVIVYAGNPPDFPAEIRPAPAPVADLSRALLTAAMALAAFMAALVMRKQPLRSMGWNFRAKSAETADQTGVKKAGVKPAGKNAPPAPAAKTAGAKAPNVFMPALQIGIALAILTIFLRNRVMDVLAGVTTAELNLLLLAIGIGLAEETIFRGYIQPRLSWWLGEWAGIGLTALLFTLWHVPAWFNRIPLETGLIVSGMTLIHGLVLGWIMRTSKNVIAPAMYRSISIWMNFLG